MKFVGGMRCDDWPGPTDATADRVPAHLVLITVVVASTAFNAATFSVVAILPQVQGALSATQDEVSWAVTFYILATAVSMPMTGWLVTNFGRGRVQFWSLASFTIATIACAFTELARRARLVAVDSGRHGRTDSATRPGHPARRFPEPAAPGW